MRPISELSRSLLRMYHPLDRCGPLPRLCRGRAAALRWAPGASAEIHRAPPQPPPGHSGVVGARPFEQVGVHEAAHRFQRAGDIAYGYASCCALSGGRSSRVRTAPPQPSGHRDAWQAHADAARRRLPPSHSAPQFPQRGALVDGLPAPRAQTLACAGAGSEFLGRPAAGLSTGGPPGLRAGRGCACSSDETNGRSTYAFIRSPRPRPSARARTCAASLPEQFNADVSTGAEIRPNFLGGGKSGHPNGQRPWEGPTCGRGDWRAGLPPPPRRQNRNSRCCLPPPTQPSRCARIVRGGLHRQPPCLAPLPGRRPLPPANNLPRCLPSVCSGCRSPANPLFPTHLFRAGPRWPETGGGPGRGTRVPPCPAHKRRASRRAVRPAAARMTLQHAHIFHRGHARRAARVGGGKRPP